MLPQYVSQEVKVFCFFFSKKKSFFLTLYAMNLLDRGAAEHARGDLPAAAATFREILAIAPQDAEALSNLAAVLNAAQDAPAAEAACRAALAASPGYWAALANLGDALHRQNRHHEAVQAYIAAVNANPGNASAWTNLGVAMAEQWRIDAALIAHNAALTLAPDDPEVHLNRALALLAAGNYTEGFAEWEWRWRCPAMPPHGMAAAQWRGETAPGHTVLVHDEAGFGDTLQFLRFLPLVAERGVRIALRVQAPLRRLVHRSFPNIIDTLFCDGATVPPHDLQCPMMSLPYALGTRVEDLPGPVPYLSADTQKVGTWHTRLCGAAGTGSLRVGLVWAGAPRLGMAQARAMNARRSLPLARLAPLAAVPGVQLVSLQCGGADEAAASGIPLFDPMPWIEDFDDTAALVTCLDLVIAVDTAVAHVAGALGRPVWVMSRYDACWRWLAGRSDSPWYPTLRLYRQSQPGDWDGVVAEAVRDLYGMVASSTKQERLLF